MTNCGFVRDITVQLLTARAFFVALGAAAAILTVPGAPAQTLQWTSIGLSTERVPKILIDPTNPSRLLAGTTAASLPLSKNNGIFRSDDGGASWTSKSMGLPLDPFYKDFPPIPLMGMDPSNSSILYAVAGTSFGSELYKSMDGGARWVKGQSFSKFLLAFTFDPVSPSTIYAGTNGGLFAAIYKTVDAGSTWKIISDRTPLQDPTFATVPSINTIVVDPASPSTVYVGTQSEFPPSQEGKVFKSTDGGATWLQATSGLATNGFIPAVTALALDPQQSSTLYAGTLRNGIFKSTDGGATWIPSSTVNPFSAPISRIVVDRTNPARIFAATKVIGDSTAGQGILMSTDAGATWQQVNSGLSNLGVLDLVLDNSGTPTLFAGTSGSGVFKLVVGATQPPFTRDGHDVPVAAACGAPDVTRHMAIANPSCAQKWAYHTYRQLAVANFGAWGDLIYAGIEGEVQAHTIRDNQLALVSAVEGFSRAKSIVDLYVTAHVEVPRLALQVIPDDENGAIILKKLTDFLLTSIEAGIGGLTPVDVAFDLAGLLNDVWAFTKVDALLEKQHAVLVARDYLNDLYRLGGDAGLLAQQYGLARNASYEEQIRAVAQQKHGFKNTMFKEDFDLIATARTIEYVRSNLIAKVVALCEASECKTNSGPTAAAGGQIAPAGALATDSLYPFRVNGKWGYVDRDGHVRIPFAFDDLRPCAVCTYEGQEMHSDTPHQGKILAVRQGGKWGLVDRSGRWVLEAKLDDLGECLVLDQNVRLWGDCFAYGPVPVKIGDHWGYLNDKGNMVIPATFDEARGFQDSGLAVVKTTDGYGVIDNTGQFVLKPNYANLAIHPGGLIYGGDNKTFGLIDRTGKQIADLSMYNGLGIPSEGIWTVHTNDRYGAIDFSGRVTVPFSFEYIGPFHEGVADAELGGKRGFIDRSGNFVIALQFEPISMQFSESLAAVRVQGKWGFIDKSGRQVIEARFYHVLNFKYSLARASASSKPEYGYIDKTGAWVILPQFDYGGDFEGDRARVIKNGKMALIDRIGRILWQELPDTELPPLLFPETPAASLHIAASALGKKAQNGELHVEVPMYEGALVDVTLRANNGSADSTIAPGGVDPLPSMMAGKMTYTWFEEGQRVAEGEQVVLPFPVGDHVIELRAFQADSPTNTSTPTVLPSAINLKPVSLVVSLKPNAKWDCMGRLGAACGDGYLIDRLVTTQSTVRLCDANPNAICVTSEMSVGAIKHDQCCQERQDQGKTPGYQCDHGSENEDQTACTDEWEQAEFDSLLGGIRVDRPDGVFKSRFKHMWVYPPELGNDVSKDEWWQHLAGPGVIMSYSDSQPDEREQSVCQSLTARRDRIGELNSDLLVGPKFALSKTHGWICD